MWIGLSVNELYIATIFQTKDDSYRIFHLTYH